ncbi:hypothetical protein GF389_04425 [Candidatus Dojkabacteria bacterium]|nr:hypothetical protein [Candidatus Dojkabacteria bacterium]
MMKSALINIFLLPVAFVALMYLFSANAYAKANTLAESIAEAKAQAPSIERTSIAGSIEYAKYQGEIVEQEEAFKEDGSEEVLGLNTEQGGVATTLRKSIELAKMHRNEEVGAVEVKQPQVLGDFTGINRGTLGGSIQFAMKMPNIDRTTLSGSILAARTQ